MCCGVYNAAMKDWKHALRQFLIPWEEREDVEAAMLGGSMAHGTCSPNSDIDVHIILSEGVKWRERGNMVVDGFLIEYFANPVRQLMEYLANDYRDGTRADARMFSTGKVLFDKTGVLRKLQKNAEKELHRQLKKMTKTDQELGKYGLWDALDNLRDLQKQRSPLYAYVYHLLLHQTITTYRKFLGVEMGSPSKLHRFFTDEMFRRKYHIKKFPDQKFVHLFLKCAQRTHVQDIEHLVAHVLMHMGDFEINGWKLHTQTTA